MKAAVAISLLALVATGTTGDAAAGEADVIEVKARCTAIRTCDFDVKVRHADVGFSHYADRYEIVAPDGELLGTRVLRHPHVHEQPFVRSIVGIDIPDGVSEVTVRAHDSVHGDGGATLTVQLVFPPGASAPPDASAPAEDAAPPAPPAASIRPGAAPAPRATAQAPESEVGRTRD